MKPKSTAQIPTPCESLRQKPRHGTNGQRLRTRLGTPRRPSRGGPKLEHWKANSQSGEGSTAHFGPDKFKFGPNGVGPPHRIPPRPDQAARRPHFLRLTFWWGSRGQEPLCWNACCQDTQQSQQVVRRRWSQLSDNICCRASRLNAYPIWCRTTPARKPNNSGTCLTEPRKAWCPTPLRLRASFTNSP